MEKHPQAMSPTTRILIGMGVGVLVGLALMTLCPVQPGPDGTPVVPAATQAVALVGSLFLRLLKMIIVPLILASMVTGVASLRDARSMGRLGTQTLLFYTLTTTIAVAIGVLLVNAIRPGAGVELGSVSSAEQAAELAAKRLTIPEMILRLVPENPVQALASMDVLGIIFFALFLGVALLSIGAERAAPLVAFFESLNAATLRMTEFIMRLAPVGVGALIAKLLAEQTPDRLAGLFRGLGLYSLTVVGGLLLHLGVYLLLIRALGRSNPFAFLRTMGPVLATAFGTASSNATLPVTFDCARKAGISRRISGFVLPIGATVNMDGTALYEAVAALFIAQAYGVALSPGAQIIVAVTAMFAAVGAAGIPSAGLVTMTMVLAAVGLPVEGIGLILAVDRILDMCRTAINVMGDTVACRVVQTWNPALVDEEPLVKHDA